MQDAELVSIRGRVQLGTTDEGWAIHIDGSLRYRGRVVVPQSTDLREEILREFHCSRLLERDEETCRGFCPTMSYVPAGQG